MRRAFLQIVFVLLTVPCVHGQKEDQSQRFVLDLLEHQTMNYGQLRVISPMDSSFFTYDIHRLDTMKTLTFKVSNTICHDSITISEEEKQLIIEALKLSYSWGEDMALSKKYKCIEKDSLLDYLKDDDENTIALISKPVFLREGTIVVAYFINLCCGDILGNLNFGFYKIEDGIWTRWIDIRAGAF